jgi:asparagine synthase (glutamine-hydrolysing)
MGEALRRRGPDHLGVFTENGDIALGNNRLAIVDLAGGNQPITNESGDLAIVFNGEIYNHAELRKTLSARHEIKTHSDTEIILHAFEEHGPACLDKLNGMFTIAIWNRREKTLFLARDGLGIKPLYLAKLPAGWAFASEAKALLPLLPGGARPDWAAISRFFSFGYTPWPDSPFAGIRKFPPGHYAWVKDGAVSMTRWWRQEYGADSKADFGQAVLALDTLMEKAVSLELMSDVPLGLFLSGGLDSSAIAYYAKRITGAPLHSFSIKFAEATHDESADARLVAAALGLEHHEIPFGREDIRRYLFEVAETLDEPFGDSTVLPLLALSRATREHVKVVLTGWGGDEIFAGYDTYKAHLLARYYGALPSLLSRRVIPALVNLLPVSDKYMSLEFRAKRFVTGWDLPPELRHFIWMGYWPEEAKRRLFTPDVAALMDQDALAPVRDIVKDAPEEDIISRILRLDSTFFLEGNGLFQADRMTMAASLEARVPMLNPALLRYVNALPTTIKMRGGRQKALLRALMAGKLPRRIISKPKKGFGPSSSQWLRGPLADLLDGVFARRKIARQGVFQSEEIRKVIAEHVERKVDHGRNLWALLSFQLWYDNYIDIHDNSQ